MKYAILLDRIANAPELKESTLDEKGIRGVLEDAFVKVTFKVQTYVDKSLQLKRLHGAKLGGLPPTWLDASYQPDAKNSTNRTASLDQQRQLYASAHVALVDPKFGDKFIDDLVDWHDAFAKNFVINTDEGPVVFGAVEFAPDGSLAKQVPDSKANIRFTYAIEGSATLVRALAQAAERNLAKRSEYLRKAHEIRDLVLSIGETFQKQFADNLVPGRYFLLEKGHVPQGNPDRIEGLSHNNSQGYLLKGMETLAALDDTGTWSKRLDQLLRYIRTRQASGSGLLHEFDFKQGGWDSSVIANTSADLNLRWQNQNNHETVILGHTVAGIWEAPANLAARAGKRQELDALIQDFVVTMNRLGGIHKNGLPGNAFELIPNEIPPFDQKRWPEGSWQAELVWQFLLRAVETGLDLNTYKVQAEGTMITLERLLDKGLELHDSKMFDGLSYVHENGKELREHGRKDGDPVNHAAETMEALARALAQLEAVPDRGGK